MNEPKRPYVKGGYDASIRGLPVHRALKDGVVKVATREHLSISQVMRIALAEYLARREAVSHS